MEFKRWGNRFVIRIDRGEEIVETIKQFCRDNKIRLGTVSGLGAANKIKIGLFETVPKRYIAKEFSGDYEIAPLYGNITTMAGDVYLHLHINFADALHHAYGGHLNAAVVSATFEGVIDVIDGEVDRDFSEEIGLNLLKF